MANTKFGSAITWLQGVVSGYQKQVNDLSALPNPDQNKVKACKDRQELCQYILDFMIKSKQQNDVLAAKAGSKDALAATGRRSSRFCSSNGEFYWQRTARANRACFRA